jgi:GT2 family glycosyltransferase
VLPVTIDVLIPNYNGAALLPPCLDALRAQTRRDFCITVVDDASQDDSLALLATRYPEVRVIALPHNRRLAAALNIAWRATSGAVVVLLNNDTEAHPQWLEHLVGALERYPTYAFAASKLLLFERRDHLHSAGDYYRPNGVPDSRGVWQRDWGQYDAMCEVFGPCAAAAAYRREALECLAVEGQLFDEDLVMYCEDVDLNLRAQRHGFRTLFVPTAIVYHQLSATGGGSLASYYCGRNIPLVWLKNMPTAALHRHWPAFCAAQLRFALQALWHGREPAARARLRGQVAAVRMIPQFLHKRGRISHDERRTATQETSPTHAIPLDYHTCL